jgi:hypothetical protein
MVVFGYEVVCRRIHKGGWQGYEFDANGGGEEQL